MNTRNGGSLLNPRQCRLCGGYPHRITAKNETGDVTHEGSWQHNRQMGLHEQHCYVEKVFEELDAPGEWFHNPKTGTLWQAAMGRDLAGEEYVGFGLTSFCGNAAVVPVGQLLRSAKGSS